jgi:capsular exopolysaccharide synthesis family protein
MADIDAYRPNGALVPAGANGALVPASPAHAVPTAFDLLKALKRRWLLATALGLLVGAVSWVLLWIFLPEGKYTASSILLVPIRPEEIYPTPLGSMAHADFAVYQLAQSAMVKSRLVLQTALRSPGVMQLSFIKSAADPIEYLQRELKADYKASPEFLTISLSGQNPDELKTLVKAVSDTYLNEVIDKERQLRLARLGQIKDLLSKYNQGLSDKEQTLRKLKKDIGSGDPAAIGAVQKSLAELSGAARKGLYEVRQDLRKLRIEVELAEDPKSATEAPVLESAIEQEIQRDPTLSRLTTRKGELEAMLAQLLPNAKRGRAEPALQADIRNIDSLDKSIRERRAELRTKILEDLRARNKRDAVVHLIQQRQKIALLERMEKALEREAGSVKAEKDDVNEKTVDLEMYTQAIAQERLVSDQLAKEQEQLKVKVEEKPRVSLFQDAAASRPDETRRRLKFSVPISVALSFLVVGLISYREFRHRRLESLQEVQLLGLSVVGTVPARPSPRGWLPLRPESIPLWQSMMTECVDGVRTRLLHASETQGLRVVMVTSAVPGEGKTSVATQLAASLARAGRKTLLIDGDIRRPAAHRVYDLPVEPGLSEVLRREAGLAEAAHPTQVRGLYVLPAGLWDQEAVAALAMNDFPAVLAQLKEQYDFVVVDSAPVLPVVDSLLIGRHVDGVLFSLMRGVSQLPSVESAHHRLTALNIPLLGAVVNGADPDGYHYSYSSRRARSYHEPANRPVPRLSANGAAPADGESAAADGPSAPAGPSA